MGKDNPHLLICTAEDGALVTSKLTSKAQTTIPAPVRAALGIRPGDEIVYEIDGDRVVLRKVDRGTADDPFATFEEWSSAADQRAYGRL